MKTPWWTNEDLWAAAHAKLKVLRCPTDNPYGNSQNGVAVLMYTYNSLEAADPLNTDVNPAASAGSNRAVGFQVRARFDEAEGGQLGRSNYAANEGAFGKTGLFLDKWRGPFHNRSQVTMEQMISGDGSSNTLFFGETLGGSRSTGNKVSNSWMGVGTSVTISGLRDANTTWGDFTSQHPAGVQFAFADGSVRTLTRGIPVPAFAQSGATAGQMLGGPSERVFLVMSGFSDREVVQTAEYFAD